MEHLMASLGRRPERESWAIAIAVLLATLFALQGTRIFVGYLVFVVDQSQRLTLGVTALGVFAAPVLAWFLIKLAPMERVMLGSVAILSVARLVLQVWEQPTARIVLGAITIVAWGWFMIPALTRYRRLSGLGILGALALDIMIRMGFGSIDLPWMPGITAHALTFVLALGLLASAVMSRSTFATETARSSGKVFPLLALGPALALHHLIIGNLAIAHSTIAQERATIWVALLAGVALGYFLLTIAGMFGTGDGRRADRWMILVAVIAGGIGLQLILIGDSPNTVGVVITPAAFFILLSALVASGPDDAIRHTPGPISLAFAGSLVIQVAMLFTYYTFTGLVLVIPIGWILLSAMALWSSRLTTVPSFQTPGEFGLVGRMIVIAVFVLPVLSEIAAEEPEATAATGAEITVMVYNIQSGFAMDRTWNLRETARVIEEQNPDVVVLNEVARGWLMMASNDQLIWLSRELGMPYVWGPASDDGLWGNVLLSRLPIEEFAVRQFASTQNLKRSAVSAGIDVDGQTLWVFGTHLDNPRGAGAARMEQVTELVTFWDDRQPAIVMGDFNATPDSDVIAALTGLGFSDPGIEMGEDAVTSEDGMRIDYILNTRGVEVLDIWIPDVDDSDHKPVVARIRVEPQ
jgi:endonuclease/exonuclease/phosphatase family metal-dependent hydrolase